MTANVIMRIILSIALLPNWHTSLYSSLFGLYLMPLVANFQLRRCFVCSNARSARVYVCGSPSCIYVYTLVFVFVANYTCYVQYLLAGVFILHSVCLVQCTVGKAHTNTLISVYICMGVCCFCFAIGKCLVVVRVCSVSII